MRNKCETCFPVWGEVEVITVPAMFPCDSCGAWHGDINPFNGEKVKVHTFDDGVIERYLDSVLAVAVAGVIA